MGKKIFIIFVLTLLFFLAVTGVVLVRTRSQPVQVQKVVSETVPEVIPEAKAAAETTSLDSPDGKMTLVMSTVKESGNATYSFLVSGNIIYEKTVDQSVSFSIPNNAWSPDNKYVFLKEADTSGVNFFVLSVTKNSSEQDDQTANISSLFSKKYTNLTIEDVTGWGGMNLIVVNSNKNDGTRGPSFWFSAPSHSITQLSTRF